MRGTEFLDRLELVDPAFIEEADQQPKKRRPVWLQVGGLAACLCVAAAAMFALHGAGQLPGTGPGVIAAPAPSQETASADPAASAPSQEATTTEPAAPTQSQETAPTVTAEPTPSAHPDVLTVDMEKIFINEMPEAPVSGDLLYYDPELYDDNVPWSAEDVAQYYGRPLAPSYVPEGLTPTNPEDSTLVIIRKEDGAVVWDTVYHGYYEIFGTWEDGTPRMIDERCVEHGFTVAASRVGLIDCCIYLYDDVKQSNIAGVPVTIGYRSMSHGPYDPDTHVPAGYYDLYVAEFTLDGIQFKITAYEMELEEVVKIAASVICPDREIVLE